ncbi:MAG: NUDIX hydrolase [Clostridia bacterium]|nr:NUDIX hydrolase [Clostridia bacterium]
MTDEELKWNTISRRELLKTPVFTVTSLREEAAGGLEGDYICLDSPECVVIIPEYGEEFVLVRQWRHGASKLTTEFPGGVIGRGEAPEEAAYRELLEETGFKAGSLTLLGSVNPNPALFNSRFYVYYARELTPTGELHPDRDELISVETRPIKEVVASYGSEEFCHAFMGTALAMYLRRIMNEN